MNKLSKDIDNHIPSSQAEIYSFLNILKNLPQIKQQIMKVKQNSTKKNLSSEHFKQIEKEFFGIDF